MGALHRAIERVTGRASTETLPYAGLLDHHIALMHLDAIGADGDLLEPVLLASVEELEAARKEVLEKGYLMPGVVDVLERLAAADGVLQTVLTGNLRANATLKVVAFGLDRWLDLEVGAYSEDGLKRTELVPVALERAERLRNQPFSPDDVWVVGDTEHDLACARAGGVHCLLVGTGWEPLCDIARDGADVVLDDLSDAKTVVEIILR